MAQIKTTRQAKQIREGVLLATGRKVLTVRDTPIIDTESIDRIVYQYSTNLTLRAYVETKKRNLS